MVMIPYCEHFFALALRPGAMELEEQEEEEGKWVSVMRVCIQLMHCTHAIG